MPQTSGRRILAAAMLVWTLTLSAMADRAVSRHAAEFRAQTAAPGRTTTYWPIPLDQLVLSLSSRSGWSGPVNDDFAAGLRTRTPPLASSLSVSPPIPVPTQPRIRRAAMVETDDVPDEIILIDYDDGCVPETPVGLPPIFESTLSSQAFAAEQFPDGSPVPFPSDFNGFPSEISTVADGECDVCNPCSPWYKVFRSFCSDPTFDAGIGQERLMYAPFEIEVPLPANYFAIRYDAAAGLRTPDRAEYFWASQKGPGPDEPERKIDYQDLRFILSAGGSRFSAVTEIPLRFIDAPGNGGTGGMGNMSIATKLLMIDGQHWKITQYFRTILQTGSVKRGLSNGHVSLEPGLLAQYKWSPERYWFGELRYWFPTGADPSHGGNVLRYSIGTSKLWSETDVFAAMSTLEFVGTSVLSGAKTLPDGMTVVNVDGEHSLAILPGLRFVLGPAGDLGLFEFGVQAGVATNDKGFYRSLARVELRFNY